MKNIDLLKFGLYYYIEEINIFVKDMIFKAFIKANPPLPNEAKGGIFGGDCAARTRDLLRVKQAL